jgi:hypothetical protein
MTPSTERPLNWREDVLLKALRIAIAHGWQGWRTYVNDAVTVGQEAEGVLRDYRRGQKPLEPLLFDHDFAKALFGEQLVRGELAVGTGAIPAWQYNLIDLALAPDRMKLLREIL